MAQSANMIVHIKDLGQEWYGEYELMVFSLFSKFRSHSPKEQVKRIRTEVAKLKSLSDAGRVAIVEERCAKIGITVDGELCFFVGRTGK